MSKDFCSCNDWKELKADHDNVFFKWQPPYGWIISSIELTEENGYTQVHRYGMKINHCPLCGKKLKEQ